MRELAGVIRRAAAIALDVVYPPRCAGCSRFGCGFFCDRCAAVTPTPFGPGFCANCSAPWDGAGFCPGCAHWDALDGARAAFLYDGAARRAVHALKYGLVRAAAAPMSAHLAPIIAGFGAGAVYPVPLHRSRVRRRGYNQSEQLLVRAGFAPGPGAIERTLKTRSQVGLSLADRRANVSGAFRYRGPELRGLVAVLVDDVITTGSTANECARVLKDHGARAVYVAGFARADPRRAGSDREV